MEAEEGVVAQIPLSYHHHSSASSSFRFSCAQIALYPYKPFHSLDIKEWSFKMAQIDLDIFVLDNSLLQQLLS